MGRSHGCGPSLSWTPLLSNPAMQRTIAQPLGQSHQKWQSLTISNNIQAVSLGPTWSAFHPTFPGCSSPNFIWPSPKKKTNEFGPSDTGGTRGWCGGAAGRTAGGAGHRHCGWGDRCGAAAGAGGAGDGSWAGDAGGTGGSGWAGAGGRHLRCKIKIWPSQTHTQKKAAFLSDLAPNQNFLSGTSTAKLKTYGHMATNWLSNGRS